MEWIDVNDRMPKENEWVLCYRHHKNGNHAIVTGQLLNNNVWSCSFNWHNKVTHWMPLPKAPGENLSLPELLDYFNETNKP